MSAPNVPPQVPAPAPMPPAAAAPSTELPRHHVHHSYIWLESVRTIFIIAVCVVVANFSTIIGLVAEEGMGAEAGFIMAMAGIGTLTFADPQTGVFGSLGHGICDAETGVLLPLSEGDLIYSTVETVTRGKSGAPGALQGDFSDARPIGTVTKNTVHGIFGTLSDLSLLSGQGALPVAARDEIQTGDAEIIANIDGDKVQRYSVQIVRLYPENDEYGRGMMLRVTDETLLAQTGGILQGMSGSPVVQNGRLIGAVTHVLVDDPASGYAICIDDMLEEAESVA